MVRPHYEVTRRASLLGWALKINVGEGALVFCDHYPDRSEIAYELRWTRAKSRGYRLPDNPIDADYEDDDPRPWFERSTPWREV